MLNILEKLNEKINKPETNKLEMQYFSKQQ